MVSINTSDIIEALREVHIHNAENIFVHSFIGAFGKVSGPEIFLDAILQTIGPSGTLIMPTYNYDYCKGTLYDHNLSPSATGVLTEYFRNQTFATRSFHPVYSHALCGPNISSFLSASGVSGFGPSSFFAKLSLENVKLVFLGASWGSATYIHHVEEMLNVPYRFHKIFKGICRRDQQEFPWEIDLFSRYLELPTVLNLNRLKLECIKRKLVAISKLGRGEISVISCRSFFEVATEMWGHDPWYFLESPLDLSTIGK